MKWTDVQNFLATGHCATRMQWKEDAYVELEDDDLLIYSMTDPEGIPYHPGAEDKLADDWFVVGIA